MELSTAKIGAMILAMEARMGAVLVRAAIAVTLLWSGYAHALSASEPNEGDLDSTAATKIQTARAFTRRRVRSAAKYQRVRARAVETAYTYSFSRHHTGTCSRHAGVATWVH